MKIIDDLNELAGKKKPKPQPSSTPKKILIVEDEKPLLEVLEDAFKKKGYETFTAENGEEGLESIKKYKPDVLLLDLIMPVMDGKHMLLKLREIPDFKYLPVIVLTNAGEVENIRITQTYFNAIEFLIKSNVSIEDIVEHVDRLIV